MTISQNLDWMSDETKVKALDKLSKFKSENQLIRISGKIILN